MNRSYFVPLWDCTQLPANQDVSLWLLCQWTEETKGKAPLAIELKSKFVLQEWLLWAEKGFCTIEGFFAAKGYFVGL